MRIVTLSGWGQPPCALSAAFPEAVPVDYAACDSLDSALARIAGAIEGAALVVGWSMGGQMALRALERGIAPPRRLALIATPLCFVRADAGGLGMPRDTFQQFRANLLRDPARTMRKSRALIAHGDERADTVGGYSAAGGEKLAAHDWPRWLDALVDFSPAASALASLPPTLLIHGENDAVVEAAQSAAWKEMIPGAALKLLPGCGHAPHWHDPERVREWVLEHAR